MLYRVFRMNERGEPLPREDYVKLARVGDLRFERRIDWVNKHWARLMTPDFEYVIPCMEPAELEIREGWLEIRGMEHTDIKGTYKNVKSTKWPQVWRCLPVPAVPIIKLPVVAMPAGRQPASSP